MILHTINKGADVNTLEKFHTYEIMKKGMQLNDMFADMINPIFDALIQACKKKQV
jgi:Leu/Phe-tRNA-protein transferase